jgi:hypothetical protein
VLGSIQVRPDLGLRRRQHGRHRARPRTCTRSRASGPCPSGASSRGP